MSRASLMSSAPLAAIHFVLGGKGSICTPVPLLTHYLEKYYPSHGFLNIEVPFDVESNAKVEEYD